MLCTVEASSTVLVFRMANLKSNEKKTGSYNSCIRFVLNISVTINVLQRGIPFCENSNHGKNVPKIEPNLFLNFLIP